MRLQAVLAEYNDLRDEIKRRIELRSSRLHLQLLFISQQRIGKAPSESESESERAKVFYITIFHDMSEYTKWTRKEPPQGGN